jgi:hypothetical protein
VAHRCRQDNRYNSAREYSCIGNLFFQKTTHNRAIGVTIKRFGRRISRLPTPGLFRDGDKIASIKSGGVSQDAIANFRRNRSRPTGHAPLSYRCPVLQA